MKISALVETLKSQYQQPREKRRPIFAQGSPGIGKSMAFETAARDLGIGFMSLQATIEDPITLSGLPARAFQDEPPAMIITNTPLPGDEGAPRKWGSFSAPAPTSRVEIMPQRFADHAVFLPFADKLPTHGEGVLCIDEINTAPPAVQAGFYSLFLNGRLGSYHLPPGWMVGATGNRDTDRAATQRIPMPLIGRWTRVIVEPDLADWTKNYALVNGVRTEIIAFFQFRPELFYTFDPQKAEPYCCPRTAVFASDIIESAPAGLEHELLCGTIGEGVATELTAFMRIYREMVSVDQILLHPDTAPVPREPAAACAIAAAVAHKSTAGNFGRVLTYAARMAKEYEVLLVSLATARDAGLCASRPFISWASDNTDVVL